MKIYHVHPSLCEHTKTHFDPKGWPMADALEVCDDCGSSRVDNDWGKSDWQKIKDLEGTRHDLNRMLDEGISENELELIKKEESRDTVKILTVVVICLAGLILSIWHFHAK